MATKKPEDKAEEPNQPQGDEALEELEREQAASQKANAEAEAADNLVRRGLT